MTAPTERMSISDPIELATLIPHLLGFRPAESVVIVGLHGPRRRLGLALRLDLVPDEFVDEAADLLAEHIERSGAEQAIVAIFTQAAGDPPGLPQRVLVDCLDERLDLLEVVLIRDSRVWSYRCSETRCCPPEGRPLDPASDSATRIAATFAGIGSGVLPSRDAVLDTLRPSTGARVEAVHAAMPAALRWRRSRGQTRAAAWADLRLTAELARFRDPRAELDAEVAARLGVVLRELPIRDLVLQRWASDAVEWSGELEPAGAWRRFFLDLLRVLPSPYDAQPLALYACAAYNDGEGILVEAAAERALEHDPACSFADLVLQVLACQVHPSRFVEVLATPFRDVDGITD